MANYDLETERRAGYLLFRVTGPNSAETVKNYMQEVVAICNESDCFRALIEEQLEGDRLDVQQIFSLTSEGAMDALGIFQAITYVDPRMGEMAKFAETVAVNRGMPMKAFVSVVEAERWLLRQNAGTAEKQLFEDQNSRDPFG